MSSNGGPDDSGEEGPHPELCDFCGAVIPGGTVEWLALVRDSSAIHAVDPRLNGKRMLVGCSREHLARLVEQYKCRPFVAAELWAGKIMRALQRHPEGISEEDLAAETGLSAEQVQRAVMWHNIEARRWLEQYGQNEDDGHDGSQ
ncbi:AsnC family protein [Streptomyces glomeratus]|uniref:Helix-turn-helix DNA binding domain protein n=1 Tax=Streptomyces glomeratus TaxID=284452 RepID=A0ABP6LQ05_9ACTN|nr:AsnC family protein [Streptomyces glomeratus]MCF1512546.1 MarR family transcriptional regulator [Streptomyces glomeratus]